MLKRLILLLVPTVEPRTEGALIANVVGIIANLCLCTIKAAVGLATGSISIVADSFNNLSDASSNVVAIIAFRLAAKPADEEHPYGHGRYEYVATLLVATLVLAVGLNLTLEAISRIRKPEMPIYNLPVLLVLSASIIVKIALSRYFVHTAHKLDSKVFTATAVDARNDVLVTAGVVLSAGIGAYCNINLDGWVAAAIGVFIVISGLFLVRDALTPLLGTVPDKKTIEYIRSKILSYPEVLGTHDLMVHDYGPGRKFASAHVEMAGEGDIFAQHEIIDTIEQDFKHSDGLVMTLHHDPIVTDDPKLKDLRHWLNLEVTKIHPDLSVHDVRTVPNPTKRLIIFDCACPESFYLTDRELKERLSILVAHRFPNATCSITLDHSFISPEQ